MKKNQRPCSRLCIPEDKSIEYTFKERKKMDRNEEKKQNTYSRLCISGYKSTDYSYKERREMDRSEEKAKTMLKSLYPRGQIDRLYV